MNIQIKNITLLVFIPLILSIGIAPALPFFDVVQEADALTKASGVGSKQFGSATKNKVCGDRLC